MRGQPPVRKEAGAAITSALGIGHGLAVLVRLYQLILRPVLGPNCRFEPSCSEYAIEALRQHGAWRGLRLAGRRILRCNPWHPGGWDPVPSHGDRHPKSCRAH